MRALLRILYGLLALAVGALISWFLVVYVNEPHERDVLEVRADSVFVDYVARQETWYADFRHQETHFHGVQGHHLLPIERQSSCLTCHDLYPHSEDRKRRAFNNQHGHFMTCLACHLEPGLRASAGYSWSSFDEVNSVTEAGPYGLRRDGAGRLENAGNLITRIVPVLRKGVEGSAIFTPYDDPRHVRFRAETVAGREPDREAFRRESEEKVGGPAMGCRDCHSAEATFPWTELGFVPGRVEELVQSSVVGMIEDYETFQFPVVD